MEGLKFSLNFYRVYHTSGSLGHVYGDARQPEVIVGTFEIGNSSYNESIQVLDRYVRLPRPNLKIFFVWDTYIILSLEFRGKSHF